MHVSYRVLELSGFVRYGASSVASEGWVSADFGAQLATCLRVLRYLGVCRNYIRASIIGGSFDGTEVVIPRIIMLSSDDTLPFVLRRRQFPVRLCFAMTINKSQSQTYGRVGLFLKDACFSHRVFVLYL